jgi:hypothetical protein
MRFAWLGIVVLCSCGGGQQSVERSGSEVRKISDLENQLEDAQSSLQREKAARLAAEQALAEAKAKCAAQVAAAAAAPPPVPVAPPSPLTSATGMTPAGTPDTAALPPPPVAPKPVAARITERTSTGSGVRLVIGAGANRGVAVGWSGNVLQGKTTKVLMRFKVTKVRPAESEAVVAGTTLEAVGANDRVELLAPGATATP